MANNNEPEFNLSQLEWEFRTNQGIALWHALEQCALKKTPMPDWVAEAVIDIGKRLLSGGRDGVMDFNKALNFASLPAKSISRARNHNLLTRSRTVMEEIARQCIHGKSIGDALFHEVADILKEKKLGPWYTPTNVKSCYWHAKHQIDKIEKMENALSKEPIDFKKRRKSKYYLIQTLRKIYRRKLKGNSSKECREVQTYRHYLF